MKTRLILWIVLLFSGVAQATEPSTSEKIEVKTREGQSIKSREGLPLMANK